MTKSTVKNSPKKVHFSPDVDLREQSKEEMTNLDSTPKSSLKKPSNNTDSSPPLKLKIKFGKDKSGTITSVKIKNNEEKFHGFDDSEISDWVVDSFEEFDLSFAIWVRSDEYLLLDLR